MKKMALLVVALISCFAMADVIILRNGKQMIIPGSYEVKGNYVVFKNAEGNLVQLPLKLVDQEKSQLATQEYKKQLIEEAKAKAAAPEPQKESMTMSEIAAEIEAKRPKDQPPPRVVLGNDKLKKFAEERPLPQNDSMPVPEFEPRTTPAGVAEARKAFYDSYQTLKTDLDKINTSLASSIEYADSLAQESAFGDDPTGSMFQAMESADKAVEDLRKQKQAKEAEMQKLEDNARRAGIRNYKNMPRGRGN